MVFNKFVVYFIVGVFDKNYLIFMFSIEYDGNVYLIVIWCGLLCIVNKMIYDIGEFFLVYYYIGFIFYLYNG